MESQRHERREELLAQVAEHAEKKHKVEGVTSTIVSYARANIRQS